jgi:hypothetical protein
VTVYMKSEEAYSLARLAADTIGALADATTVHEIDISGKADVAEKMETPGKPSTSDRMDHIRKNDSPNQGDMQEAC